MKNIWLIGAGKFGLRAAKWLMRNFTPVHITMVDLDHESLELARDLGCETVVCDGVEFLCHRLEPASKVDWVVPAVPVHLAWLWCLNTLGPDRVTPSTLPNAIDALLPNAMRSPDASDIYVSHADFICPPNCDEPDDICTKTGRKRKQDMFALLRDIRFKEIYPLVIQSEQLGPGVGGYRPAALFDLREQISGCPDTFFVATSCRCHAVVSGGTIKVPCAGATHAAYK